MNTGPLGNPKIWVPDCSQGICTFYCPQWCSYTLSPPPPSLEDVNPGPNFSPLFIVIIGILASALLIVSYYAILSKYCGNRASSSTMQENNPVVLRDNNDPSGYEPWFVSSNGLDEALIRSITVFKYKKGDGCLIQETECSVCLSEFEENQCLRLLPKCHHAFHVHCIDTWFKSHSNCPLCRANVALVATTPSPVNESLGQSRGDIENVVMIENVESSTRNDDGCLPRL